MQMQEQPALLEEFSLPCRSKRFVQLALHDVMLNDTLVWPSLSLAGLLRKGLAYFRKLLAQFFVGRFLGKGGVLFSEIVC